MNEVIKNSSDSKSKRLHVLVSGMVQGVFFRAETKKQALKLGLTGWVRNLEDSQVEALFEGDEGAISEMVAWCRKGPAHAQVRSVETRDEKSTGEIKDFSIHY